MKQPANLCGPAVARLRRAKGLTQAGLQQRCRTAGWPVARSILAKVETQRRSVSDFELVDLAAALRVRVARLLAEPRAERKSHARL